MAGNMWRKGSLFSEMSKSGTWHVSYKVDSPDFINEKRKEKKKKVGSMEKRKEERKEENVRSQGKARWRAVRVRENARIKSKSHPMDSMI
jgi:hypothetical protein